MRKEGEGDTGSRASRDRRMRGGFSPTVLALQNPLSLSTHATMRHVFRLVVYLSLLRAVDMSRSRARVRSACFVKGKDRDA